MGLTVSVGALGSAFLLHPMGVATGGKTERWRVDARLSPRFFFGWWVVNADME